jgi:hypothetical protein
MVLQINFHYRYFTLIPEPVYYKHADISQVMKQLLVTEYVPVVRFPEISITHLLQYAQPVICCRPVSRNILPSKATGVSGLIRGSTLAITFKA